MRYSLCDTVVDVARERGFGISHYVVESHLPVSLSPRSALTLSNKVFCNVERSADVDDCNDILDAVK